MSEFIYPLFGGVLIGLSVTIMLIFNGRITGISGILYGSLHMPWTMKRWRMSFLSGLLLSGFFLALFFPQTLENTLEQPLWLTALGGFLVGFGTTMGNGCTSGHGVCGISRFSVRSILATVNFIFFGIIGVYILNHLLNFRGGI